MFPVIRDWLSTPEVRRAIAAIAVGVLGWAIHASFLDTIGLLLFPLLFGLLLFNVLQIRDLLAKRLALHEVGMSGSEWLGCVMLRASAVVVLVAVFVSPSPEITRDPDVVFTLKQRMDESGSKLDQFNIMDLPILTSILMTMLPVVGFREAKNSNWPSLTKSFLFWGMLLTTIVYLAISSGYMFYLTNVSTSEVKFGFPRSYYHGEFPTNENLHDRVGHLADYQRVTLLVLVSSALTLLGGCVALGSRRCQWAGIFLWGCAASISLPQFVWLVQIGWKEQYVFKDFEGLPFELNSNGFLYLFLPLMLIVAAVLGGKTRTVLEPGLIRQVLHFSPPLWLYWLVIGTFDLTWVAYRPSLGFGGGLPTFAFAITLLLFTSDRYVWQRFSRLPKWLATIHFLLLIASFVLFARPFYDRFSSLSKIGEAHIVVYTFLSILVLVFALRLIKIQFRPRLDELSGKLPTELYLRDLDLARNVFLVPMFLVGVIVFYVAASLTLVSYAELAGWLAS